MLALMRDLLTIEQIAPPLQALAAEEEIWQLDAVPAQEDGRTVQIGKLAAGEYYSREINAASGRPGAAEPIDAGQALALRQEFDDVYAFRLRLAAGLLGELPTNENIQQNSNGDLYAFARTSHNDLSSQYPVYYHLRITAGGEIFLTHDSDLYGQRALKFAGVSVETAYTYHVSPATNHVGRVIYPTGTEVQWRYRRQDEPYKDYFARVAVCLRPFDITIAA